MSTTQFPTRDKTFYVFDPPFNGYGKETKDDGQVRDRNKIIELSKVFEKNDKKGYDENTKNNYGLLISTKSKHLKEVLKGSYNEDLIDTEDLRSKYIFSIQLAGFLIQDREILRKNIKFYAKQNEDLKRRYGDILDMKVSDVLSASKYLMKEHRNFYYMYCMENFFYDVKGRKDFFLNLVTHDIPDLDTFKFYFDCIENSLISDFERLCLYHSLLKRYQFKNGEEYIKGEIINKTKGELVKVAQNLRNGEIDHLKEIYDNYLGHGSFEKITTNGYDIDYFEDENHVKERLLNVPDNFLKFAIPQWFRNDFKLNSEEEYNRFALEYSDFYYNIPKFIENNGLNFDKFLNNLDYFKAGTHPKFLKQTLKWKILNTPEAFNLFLLHLRKHDLSDNSTLGVLVDAIEDSEYTSIEKAKYIYHVLQRTKLRKRERRIYYMKLKKLLRKSLDARLPVKEPIVEFDGEFGKGSLKKILSINDRFVTWTSLYRGEKSIKELNKKYLDPEIKKIQSNISSVEGNYVNYKRGFKIDYLGITKLTIALIFFGSITLMILIEEDLLRIMFVVLMLSAFAVLIALFRT